MTTTTGARSAGSTAGLGSVDELHEVATVRTGLDDFGGTDYLEALEVLLASYRDDAALTEAGIAGIRSMILDILGARLTTQQSWLQNPGFADVAIERPIFVTGLPRTGTTALHRLLCVDSAHQGIEHWLADTPQPRPPRESWDTNPDYRRLQDSIDRRHAADPGFKGLHFMAADMVEECWRLERQSLLTVAFQNTAHLPTYSAWLADQNMTPAYDVHRRVLQLVGINDQQRRWVLKSPSHIFNLDTLMATYPDALIVQTHRDPRTIVASVSSLNQKASTGRSTVFHGDVVGRDCLELWARGAEAAMEARTRYDPAQFIDVHYEDFVKDAVGTVDSIYRRFGLPFSDEARAAVDASHAESKISERRPVHRYDLADFGLSSAEVGERFTDYLETYFPEAHR
ncbi:sulfotransferase [Nocardioides sp. JQ2195]|uniref:sulfotransferase family protein n=1 Tax=Nocardioides sp. JQ2195 TaxID=2592334 RepID=UPI00143EC520|nr:sulfotransferase [Nocardioides sp. JQ2195]QIX26511.1 sulfotransferase [Nocardioides sp. JQ2195]